MPRVKRPKKSQLTNIKVKTKIKNFLKHKITETVPLKCAISENDHKS